MFSLPHNLLLIGLLVTTTLLRGSMDRCFLNNPDTECYTGTWISLNTTNIDGRTMRAREFSLTEISRIDGREALVTKRSFILGPHGDYLVYEETVRGEFYFLENRALFRAGDELWRLHLNRRGDNSLGRFSVFELAVEIDEGSRRSGHLFFEDHYYRVDTPDSSVLEGSWVFQGDRTTGRTALSQYSTIVFGEGSLFNLDDVFWLDADKSSRELIRDLKGEGSWKVGNGQVRLVFDQARPYRMEGNALDLHFLGFNGNQMRLLDERGFLWKLQKQ